MKREYTVDEFKLCVKKLLQSAPKMTISTDIICAFPFEGEKEWQETMDLCREISFPVLNISRFYPRRGTPAAAMKQIPTDVAKKRTQEISNLFNHQSAIDNINVAVGDVATTWLVEVAHDKHSLVGHTKQFVQVLVDPSEASLGDLVQVKITEVLRFCAKAKVEKIVVKNSEYTSQLEKKNSSSAAGGDTNTTKAMIEDTYGTDEDEEDEDETQNTCCGTSSSACCGSAASPATQDCCQTNSSQQEQQQDEENSLTNDQAFTLKLLFGGIAFTTVALGAIVLVRSRNQS